VAVDMPWVAVAATPWAAGVATAVVLSVVVATVAAPWVVIAVAATPAGIAAAMDTVAAMGTATVAGVAVGDLELDLVLATPTTAAITDTRTLMDTHITAAIQIRIIRIPTPMLQIRTALRRNTLHNSSISTDHHRSNSNMSLPRINGKAILHNRMATRLLPRRMDRHSTPGLRRMRLRQLSHKPTATTSSRTASGAILAAPILSRVN
jgi:hypothetical protein